MNEKDIIRLFSKYYLNDTSFNKNTVLELIELMEYLKTQLKDKNRNWSIKNAKTFCEKNNIEFRYFVNALESFYRVYARRKKEIKLLKKLIDNCKLLITKERVNKMKKYKSHIELLNKSNIKEFLSDIKDLKNKHLNCTDEVIINLISKEFKTGYKKSTLRNYYYDQFV